MLNLLMHSLLRTAALNNLYLLSRLLIIGFWMVRKKRFTRDPRYFEEAPRDLWVTMPMRADGRREEETHIMNLSRQGALSRGPLPEAPEG